MPVNDRIENTILFEDTHMILCRKEAGVPVQSAKFGAMDMENALKNYLAQKEPGKMPYLGLIHRLDQPVEGIIAFAKTPKAAKELSRQLTDGSMKKCYLAVTDGAPQSSKGELKDYLRKDGKTNTSSVTKKGTPGSKEARLTYEVLETKENRSLLKVVLDTGRHHQIRVQLAHEGCPIAGDQKYGGSEEKGMPLALCAYELTFVHPATRKKMTWKIQPKGRLFQEYSFVRELTEK